MTKNKSYPTKQATPQSNGSDSGPSGGSEQGAVTTQLDPIEAPEFLIAECDPDSNQWVLDAKATATDSNGLETQLPPANQPTPANPGKGVTQTHKWHLAQLPPDTYELTVVAEFKEEVTKKEFDVVIGS